ncbi:MAG: hypothetical protein AAFY97_02860 [Pseudomonadota bacterium]
MQTLKLITLIVLIPFGWEMSEDAATPPPLDETEACRLDLDPSGPPVAQPAC